jgi:hypothetical protein
MNGRVPEKFSGQKSRQSSSTKYDKSFALSVLLHNDDSRMISKQNVRY